MGKEIRKAAAYLRTSSEANVGADKDSDKRQRSAIEACAKGGELRDRRDLLRRCGERLRSRRRAPRLRRDVRAAAQQRRPDNHCRKSRPLRPRPHGAARWSRYAQIERRHPRRGVGAQALRRGHADSDPGAAGARRDRRVREGNTRRQTGCGAQAQAHSTGEKVEGRKSHAEVRPEVVKLAKVLARKKPKGGRLSLRAIAGELAAQGT